MELNISVLKSSSMFPISALVSPLQVVLSFLASISFVPLPIFEVPMEYLRQSSNIVSYSN